MARDDLQATVARNRAEASNLAARVGRARVRRLLEKTEADLVERLHRAEGLRGPGKGSFTAAQLRATLAQVRDVLKQTRAGIRNIMLDQASTAAEKSAEHLVEYLSRAERKFKGMASQPLALREAAVLDAAREGAQASVLRRLASSGTPARGADDQPHPAKRGVLDRYGLATVKMFEEELRVGLVSRKPWAEVRSAIVEKSPFLQQAPAYWAERIVRTETAGAYNRAGWEGIREAHRQLGDMVKILSCTFDERTGADSIAVHGQIRRPEEAFETWFGFVQHPPDRPNDRAVVVPHRTSWPIPPYLTQREDSEVLARWEKEKRKGAPPGRPLMTTVPLSTFGARG